jgi:hypothetical protein
MYLADVSTVLSMWRLIQKWLMTKQMRVRIRRRRSTTTCHAGRIILRITLKIISIDQNLSSEPAHSHAYYFLSMSLAYFHPKVPNRPKEK